jgi:hypothetical protein
MLENTLATTPHARLNCCRVALKLKDPKTEFYHYVSTTGQAGSLMHMQPKKKKKQMCPCCNSFFITSVFKSVS